MTDLIQQFTNKYEAKVGESRERYATMRRVAYPMWNIKSTASVYDHSTAYDYEYAVEVTLRRDQFVKLIENDYHYSRLQQQVDYNEQLVNRMREDQRVCMTNPAVQLAYDKYKMLLELSRT
jgi:hypothetical protein